MADAEPVITDGEVNLSRHATLYHRSFGPIDRRGAGPEPVGGATFRVPDAPGAGEVYIEYTVEQFEEAWETTLFASPLHVEEVLDDDG